MIFTRIDTYSVILHNCSIKNLIDYLGIDSSNINDLFDKEYKKTDVKIGDTFVFSFNGIRIECKFDDYIFHKEATNIFDVEFQWLRLYLSSEGIDFLLNTNKDIEGYDLISLFCDPSFWDSISTCHRVTRCDFAFDFVNCFDDNFIRFRKIISNADFSDRLSNNGRLFNGVAGGLTYSYHGGKDRTIYLGSTSADRMLRIYDKKFQLCDQGLWELDKVPQCILDEELSIESWHRIELQCREGFAERYLVSCQGDFSFIMGEIRSFFDVYDVNGKRIAPWHKVLEGSKNMELYKMQNGANSKSVLQCKVSWLQSVALSHVLVVAGIYGVENFIDLVNKSVHERMQSLNRSKRISFINKINSMVYAICLQEGIKPDSFGNVNDLIKADDGCFYLSKRSLKLDSLGSVKGPYQNE